MRISSNTIFDSNVASMTQQQARLMQTQQQIASGRRMLTASDDPVAAARALELNQSDAINTQYAANRTAARHKLSLAESSLQSVTSLLQDVQTATVKAGNGTLNSSDRKTIATELSGRLQELTGLANSTDGTGNYLFAGFQSKTQPFVNTPTGMGYFGDDGQHNVQVSAARQIASSDSGADVFMRVKNGNGTFITQAAATNTGTGAVSSGSVTNPAALVAGNSYSISFSLVAGVMNYAVTGAPVTLGAPVTGVYVSGQTISFDGMQLDIQGTPAVTDTFTVTPSTNESIFTTISDLIAALNAPVAGASLTNSLNRGLNNLDNALNNVLTTRSSLGLRLNEIDALQSAGEDLGLQFKQTLSQLQDTDYNKAISELTQLQMGLQAAQKSFVKIADLSLFSYI
ncbi:MAG: flagellar hook-associated protein 3 [Gallionellales bacterium GWA2_59_43]|nr:MAG: flagellar hook-associated protein 3 [Gallionellales bacterium GWA2_59_43]